MQNHKVSSSSWYNLSASFACSFFLFIPVNIYFFFSVTSSALNCSLMFFYDVMWLRRWAGFTLWRLLSFFSHKVRNVHQTHLMAGKKESARARARRTRNWASPRLNQFPWKKKKKKNKSELVNHIQVDWSGPSHREPRSGNKPAVKRSSIITQTTWNNNNPTNHSWNGPL